MHKEEGVSLVAIVGKIYNYLRYPSADQALGHRHIGYPGSVSTKKHRKMIKKQKAEQKTKS
jgi:hypothetical protein